MKIFVKVKTNARQEAVKRINNAHYMVQVKCPPVDGQANQAVTIALAKYLKIARTRISLSRGSRSKQKTFEII